MRGKLLWFELTCVVTLIAGLMVLGGRIGGAGRRKAEAACCLSALSALFVALLHWFYTHTLLEGLDWIIASRLKFLILAAAVALGLSSSLGHLSRSWQRCGVLAAMLFFLYVFIGLPFVLPALMQNQTRTLPLLLDERGLCMQSRPYTCGPAAAVSALGRLGISVHEGTLAVESRTAPLIGTGMWDLYRALEEICEKENVSCRYERLADPDRLPPDAVCLVSLRQSVFMSHCVVVLSVDDEVVTCADPAVGLLHTARPSFEAQWSRTAIILTKNSGPFHAARQIERSRSDT